MPTTIIKLVLKWLAGITADQWDDAVGHVIDIAKYNLAGHEKATAFADVMTKVYKAIPAWAMNLLREAAVAFARKKGWIA
jgi:hypothetical protein